MPGRPTRILVVGQTPPPLGGQAVMIERLLRLDLDGFKLDHVRMGFSKDMTEVGRPGLGKLLHLAGLVFRVWLARVRTGARILYYPPAGPDRTPAYRDIALLLLTRPMFERTVFHFHAGGISELYPRLSRPMRWLFRRAYFDPDLAIRVSHGSPGDPAFLRAKHAVVVPDGIEDIAPRTIGEGRVEEPPRLLYVGVLRESKGLLVLAEACGELARRGLHFSVELMGRFASPEFESSFWRAAARLGVADRIAHLGVLAGTEKEAAFQRAFALCFPTFFESETFGLVVLEAMQFALPVVATRWRGLPELVRDGETGLLVPVRDSAQLAAKLEELLRDPVLARGLGARGREIYQSEYTIEAFRRRMQAAFELMVEKDAPAAVVAG